MLKLRELALLLVLIFSGQILAENKDEILDEFCETSSYSTEECDKFRLNLIQLEKFNKALPPSNPILLGNENDGKRVYYGEDACGGDGTGANVGTCGNYSVSIGYQANRTGATTIPQ